MILVQVIYSAPQKARFSLTNINTMNSINTIILIILEIYFGVENGEVRCIGKTPWKVTM